MGLSFIDFKLIGAIGLLASFVSASPKADDCTGTSVFESAMQKNGGHVPKDFLDIERDVLSQMKDLGVTNANISQVDVAKSLSPEGNITNYSSPRSIYSFDASYSQSHSELVPPPVFIGRQPSGDQLQVISYVPQQGCYKFLEIDGFKNEVVDSRPRLQVSQRAVCIQCHQNEAPIFPKFPWSNTSSSFAIQGRIKAEADKFIQAELGKYPNIPSDNLKKTLSGLQSDDFHGTSTSVHDFIAKQLGSATDPDTISKLMKDINSAPFFNASEQWTLSSANASTPASVNINVDAASSIDESIRKANRVTQAAQVCEHLCGSNSGCKKDLLATALFGVRPIMIGNGSEDSSSQVIAAYLNQQLQSFSSNWPKDNFGYRSSVLPNYDPTVNEDQGGTTTLCDLPIAPAGAPSLLTGIASTYDENNSIDGDFCGVTGTTTLVETGIKGFADPKNPRPKVSEIKKNDIVSALSPFAAASCFGIDENDMATLSKVSADTLVNRALYDSKVSEILSSTVFDKAALLATLTRPMSASDSTASGKVPISLPSQNNNLPIAQNFAQPNPSLTAAAKIIRIDTTGMGQADAASNEKALKALVCRDPDLQAVLGDVLQNINGLNKTVQTVLKKVPLSPADKTKALGFFGKYCSECHADAGDYTLPLTSPDALKTFKGKHTGLSPFARLTSGEMPPSDAAKPTPEERDLMEELVQP